jgi:alkyl sulfatase BDS1-like metallo-beta-lactamase superfamily hydrolase
MKRLCVLTAVALMAAACGKPAPAPSAAVTTPQDLAQHSNEFKREVIKAADGVWVAVGYGIANSILIEGTDGNIVVDTMESMESARSVAQEFAKVSSKPVKAIIYTHSHPDHIGGAPAYIAPGTTVPIYAQEDVARNMDKISSELQPIITKRALRMYGWGLTPEERVNVGVGGELELHDGSSIEIVRPTKTFRDTLDDTVAGIHFQLVHAPGETDDHLFVWLPERKVLLPGDNLYRAFPNLYTIRGTSFRDPKKWAASLDQMRRLHAAVLVPSHTRPLAGEKLIETTLTDYRDAIRYVQDQTIRLINAGLLPDEIAERITLPPHLARSPFLQPFYGKASWSSKNIYAGQLGWFDGTPEHLNPLPPRQEAEHLQALAGGAEKLDQAIDLASQKKDLQWVLQLTGAALRLNPNDEVAKSARLDALLALGQAESNPNARHWYLSAYHELHGDLKLPDRVVTPTPEMLREMPLSTFFDGLAVNLDAAAAAETMTTVRFEFSDVSENWTYIVRRGVSEVIAPGETAPDADVVVRVPAQVFKEMLAKLRNPAITIAKDFEMKKGGKLDIIRFMKLFAPPEASEVRK